MRKSPEGLVFVLSACLPGLGQAYQKRWVPTLLFFALFAIAIERRLAPWCLPLLALGAAFEAFVSQKRAKPVEADASSVTARRRLGAFGIVAAVGGVAWLFFCLTFFLPYRQPMVLAPEITALASWIRNCRHALGHVPASLDECKNAPAPPLQVDPWRRALHYRAEGEGFQLRSDGPNGVAGDDDDTTYRFH